MKTNYAIDLSSKEIISETINKRIRTIIDQHIAPHIVEQGEDAIPGKHHILLECEKLIELYADFFWYNKNTDLLNFYQNNIDPNDLLAYHIELKKKNDIFIKAFSLRIKENKISESICYAITFIWVKIIEEFPIETGVDENSDIGDYWSFLQADLVDALKEFVKVE